MCPHALRLGLLWSHFTPLPSAAGHPQMVILNEMSLPPLTAFCSSACTMFLLKSVSPNFGCTLESTGRLKILMSLSLGVMFFEVHPGYSFIPF